MPEKTAAQLKKEIFNLVIDKKIELSTEDN